jgi:hypothetical protein
MPAMLGHNVLSITAAPPGEWYAVYTDSDGTHYAPIAVWAVVEEDEMHHVVGIDPAGEGWGGEACPDTGNFSHYVHRSDLPDTDGTA